MPTLTLVDGAPVISAMRVPWIPDDDSGVLLRCESRAKVLVERGGAFDAVVVEGMAIFWERGRACFRCVPVDEWSPGTQLRDVAERLQRIATMPELRAENPGVAGTILHTSAVIANAAARLTR